MVDVNRVLKNVVKSGKVKLGLKESKAALDSGAAKLVILAKNCPNKTEMNKLASSKKIPLYNYESKSIDMGYACGKQFPVSILVVLDEGESSIMQLVKKRQKND